MTPDRGSSFAPFKQQHPDTFSTGIQQVFQDTASSNTNFMIL